MPDLRARELWAVGPLIALIIVLGVYPQPVLNIINPAVSQTLARARSADPRPPHPAPPHPAAVSHVVRLPDGRCCVAALPAKTDGSAR
jgi:hypothetical protein